MSIDIEHVSFSYGKHQVLRDVNASIPDGVLVNVLSDINMSEVETWAQRCGQVDVVSLYPVPEQRL